MDETRNLIAMAHEGDKRGKRPVGNGQCGTDLEYCEKISGKRV